MSNKQTEEYLEARHEVIISNLTPEQEDTLQKIHAEQCEGVLDDDMPDDFEAWLMDLTVMDLESYLEL